MGKAEPAGEPPPPPGLEGETLVRFYIPALVILLEEAESIKGAPLTEDEVNRLQAGALYHRVPADVAEATARDRGYSDLDPENCWESWQAFVRERDAAASPPE
jgi:hypothetical protein